MEKWEKHKELGRKRETYTGPTIGDSRLYKLGIHSKHSSLRSEHIEKWSLHTDHDAESIFSHLATLSLTWSLIFPLLCLQWQTHWAKTSISRLQGIHQKHWSLHNKAWSKQIELERMKKTSTTCNTDDFEWEVCTGSWLQQKSVLSTKVICCSSATQKKENNSMGVLTGRKKAKFYNQKVVVEKAKFRYRLETKWRH